MIELRKSLVVASVIVAMLVPNVTLAELPSSLLAAEEQETDLGATLATAKAEDRIIPVYRLRWQLERYSYQETRWHLLAFLVGAPAFSLQPGEVIEVLDIFPNDAESVYTCKIRSRSKGVGFVLRTDVEIVKWHGERGTLIGILFDQPYEYESGYLNRREIIKRLEEFIRNNPSGRFAPFAG